MLEHSRSTCSRCQIGQLRRTHLPYATIENGKLISVPSMPALVCDVCGHRIFEREPVKQLHMMLGAARHRRNNQQQTNHRRPARPPKAPTRRTSRTKKP